MAYPGRYAEYEPPLDAFEAALTVRIVGWLLVVHDALFVLFFVPASMRDGSRLFLAWSALQGLIGLAMVVAAHFMNERAMATEVVTAPEKTKEEIEEDGMRRAA